MIQLDEEVRTMVYNQEKLTLRKSTPQYQNCGTTDSLLRAGLSPLHSTRFHNFPTCSGITPTFAEDSNTLHTLFLRCTPSGCATALVKKHTSGISQRRAIRQSRAKPPRTRKLPANLLARTVSSRNSVQTPRHSGIIPSVLRTVAEIRRISRRPSGEVRGPSRLACNRFNYSGRLISVA